MIPGGTESSTAPFLSGLGLALMAPGLYPLLDPSCVSLNKAGNHNQGLGAASGWEPSSRNVIIILLKNGIAVWAIIVEILTHLQFYLSVRSGHLILIPRLAAACCFAGFGRPEKLKKKTPTSRSFAIL